MTNKFSSLFVFLLFSQSSVAEIKTFTQAKRALFKQYATNAVTFYCRCPYDKYKRIDLKKCGYGKPPL